ISIILERTAKHNQAWNDGDQSEGLNVGTPSLPHLMKENQMMIILATYLALLTKKLTE
ncbi:hypothetical protein HAX54_040437, partial [Datura stramonium]|nr:hypothetical protein [Datura stramonium]